MKNIILSLVLVALVGIVYADNEGTSSSPSESPANEMVSFSGKVMDFASGEVLTGVEVTIEGTDIKTYTDFDGNFTIDNVKPGKYNIIASYISYERSLVENFEATNDQADVNIKLQESK
ncbi:MAG: carboxypeptidase-like regulatory domain-containing protein [Bacteroidales bacterium]